MRIDTLFLKQLVPFEGGPAEMAELLTSIGMEIEAFHGADRSVLEFEITPNRPDWLSHYGVAREVAAKQRDLTFTPLPLPEITPAAEPAPFRLFIEDPADCGRYTGAVVRGLKVKDSPPWAKTLLERLGLRPINDIVDFSNLVMLVCGHPLHIFDLKRIEKNEIRVRRAAAGETLILLDGQKVTLGPDQLVIADHRRPVALAGIMGGLESGVSENTRDIFIESAHFHPPLIRLGARALGLKTDASYRFERGMDIENTPSALRLFLKWLAEEHGGELEVAFYQDLYPRRLKPLRLRLDKEFPERFTGVQLDPALCSEILQKLGFTVAVRGKSLDVTVPSFRVDVSGREDLVEEIIRIHGFDRLRSELPCSAGMAVLPSEERQVERDIGQHLVALGFYEVINYVFGAAEENRQFQDDKHCLTLKNPLGRDFAQMKASLLPHLLKNCTYNLDQGQRRLLLFEIGRVFSKADAPREEERLALCATGEYHQRDWRTPASQVDFFLFRSLLSSLFHHLRWQADWQNDPHPFFDPTCSFSIRHLEQEVGRGGMVLAEAAREHGLEQPVYAAELDLSLVRGSAQPRYFQMWNRYPASTRDFSFLMDRALTFDRLASAIGEVKPAELEEYLLVDLFQSDKLPPGKVGLSLSFTYRGLDRTLTAEETNELHRRLTGDLAARLNLVQR